MEEIPRRNPETAMAVFHCINSAPSVVVFTKGISNSIFLIGFGNLHEPHNNLSYRFVKILFDI